MIEVNGLQFYNEKLAMLACDVFEKRDSIEGLFSHGRWYIYHSLGFYIKNIDTEIHYDGVKDKANHMVEVLRNAALARRGMVIDCVVRLDEEKNSWFPININSLRKERDFLLDVLTTYNYAVSVVENVVAWTDK